MNYWRVKSLINMKHKVQFTRKLTLRQRGSGKSYNVFKELIKLSQIKNCYTLFIYVTDSNNDQTYKKMSTLITIPTKIVIYGEIDGELNDLIEATAAYDTIIGKHLINQLTLDSKQNILSTVGASNFEMKYPHTIVLFDDAMSVFKNKQLPLFKKLLKNRLSRITYFLCLQDIIEFYTSLKAKADTIYFFGGFNIQKFNLFNYQSSISFNKDKILEQYINLSKRQALKVQYSNDHTKIKILYSQNFIN